MKSIHNSSHNFLLASLFFCIISLLPSIPVYAQDGSYSAEAQRTLDNYSADNLDVFKFSINNILNSDGDVVEKPAGNPSIFGRTDYGSEFFLENELSTAFSIEIPAFVINDLALDPLGEYFPIIIDGTEELSIDFKDLYDTENGEAVTPKMGFVKIIDDATSSDLENLSNGEIVEFFVRPTDEYLTQHNNDNLFFIDRPIPENPVVSELGSNETGYETSSSSDENKTNTILVPGEEGVALPSGDIKIYVTSVYVPAPASQFEPTQIVMPVLADGDYNYNIEPAAAETFTDDIQVVALPDEEAKTISEKVKAIKAAKAKSQKYKRKRETPVIDAELEPLIALLKLDIENGKSSNKLLLDAKKNIRKNFPNISNELVNLVISLTDPDERLDLIRDPKKFLDNEFSQINNLQGFDPILRTNLSKKELTKIYNLIMLKFSSDLADLGFATLRNQKIDFSDNIKNTDQILERVQLQQDLLAITSLLRSDRDASSLLIDPIKTNPDSSTKLFESSGSQKVFDQMKQFSEVINTIISPFDRNNTIRTISGDNTPVIEINVQLGESIADALQEKLNKDKRLNRNFQTRSQNSKLDKFDFEIPTQDESLDRTASPALLADAPNISDQELQLVAETTEATNNILNETITRMLKELGENPSDESYTQPVLAASNVDAPNQETQRIQEDFVFSNALSSAQKLREIEDIRAIFQILGIGS